MGQALWVPWREAGVGDCGARALALDRVTGTHRRGRTRAVLLV